MYAYKSQLLGDQTIPEDTHPEFNSPEERLTFFTLPMALNYQRNSYKLWEAATNAFNDLETHKIFSIKNSANMDIQELQKLLVKHRVALQPNKHTDTWQRISQTIYDEFGSLSNMIDYANYDFLKLQEILQVKFKRGFPYLSGPKIFHYWAYILGEYGNVKLANREFIQITPDTHVIQCSIKLGVISEVESKTMMRDDISKRWREILDGTNIAPIDMHSPLWFWSRNNFQYNLY